MKVLLLNGSPRKGNTHTALEALKKGLQNIDGLELQWINANDVKVSPCIACKQCRPSQRCVFDDDTNDVIDAIVAADAVVFATPVYWWGMTAQMKLIIDKLYAQLQNIREISPKVGVIVIGEHKQEDPQYEIIPKQFQCICDYLGWNVIFSKTYTAFQPEDLAQQEDTLKEIEELWKAF